MYIIATDLDRTLLPNGNQEYDGSMSKFKEMIKSEKLKLIFVTGRHISLVKDAIKEFKTPLPDYIIGDVGTKIYSNKDGTFTEDTGWIELIKSLTKSWDIELFKQELSQIKNLKIQEESKQNEFKLSYYVQDLTNADEIVCKAKEIIGSLCEDAIVIYSVDETCNQGLLDILPKHATKLTGLEYLRKKLGQEMGHVIYCGDSGNDILPLTFGYQAILVRNAVDKVRESVRHILEEKNILNKLYISKGYQKLNGYYVSGILEGLIKFKIIPESYAQ